MKQTILGAGGIIGTELARNLPDYTQEIRLTSRTPKAVNGDEELVSANLLNAQETSNAVKGSSIVYLTVGLPYNTKIWQIEWPIIMKNVIDACEKHSAKLVFFDNVYMYGKAEDAMTEETPYNPSSKKGEVRKEVALMVENAIQEGRIQALIAM